MQHTELGVYILGATALAILAAAGISTGDYQVMVAVTVAAGAAYLSQICAAMWVEDPQSVLRSGNVIFMLVAFASWAFGAYALAT